MFIPQTLSEYIDNPMGKGSTAIANRNLIKSDLDSRYNKLLEKHKDFKHTMYYDVNTFYAHILIPSESERNNTYDVVIQFVPLEKEVIQDVNLNRYCIKVFSNCPSFTYTYAYVYNDYDMMIDFLRNKYRNQVLQDNPIVKNPGEIINFEKSIYFAAKYIQSNKTLMNKFTLASIAKRMNKVEFAKTIRNTDTIELEIKKENNRLKNEKEENLKKLRAKLEKPNNGRPVHKIAGTKKEKENKNHYITPHPKIKGKPKIKRTK